VAGVEASVSARTCWISREKMKSVKSRAALGWGAKLVIGSGDHQRHALLREHDLHRIALLLELVEG